VNLLILDDLGTEPGSDSKYAELLSLLELRKAQGKNNIARTIISSNLDFKRLFQEYNERIASRIIGEFQALQFAGEDIRILKKLKR
jgi:DNA replication protein DnaC